MNKIFGYTLLLLLLTSFCYSQGPCNSSPSVGLSFGSAYGSLISVNEINSGPTNPIEFNNSYTHVLNSLSYYVPKWSGIDNGDSQNHSCTMKYLYNPDMNEQIHIRLPSNGSDTTFTKYKLDHRNLLVERLNCKWGGQDNYSDTLSIGTNSYSYNDKEQIENLYFQAENYVNEERYIYSEDYVLEKYIYSRINNQDSILNYREYDFVYDQNSRLENINKLAYNSAKDTLLIVNRCSYLYDIANNVTSCMRFVAQNGELIPSDSLVYVHYEDEQLRSFSSYEWDSAVKDWALNYSREYVYNQYESIDESLFYYDLDDDNYDLYTDYRYNENQELESRSTYISIWGELNYYSGFDHDTTVTINQILYPFGFDYHQYQKSMILKQERYSAWTWGTYEYYTTNYYYSEQVASIPIEKIDSRSFIVFPNPAHEVIKIKIDGSSYGQLNVLDSKGNSHLNVHCHSNEEIDISQWPAGLYFLSISLNDQVLVNKLLKL